MLANLLVILLLDGKFKESYAYQLVTNTFNFQLSLIHDIYACYCSFDCNYHFNVSISSLQLIVSTIKNVEQVVVDVFEILVLKPSC